MFGELFAQDHTGGREIVAWLQELMRRDVEPFSDGSPVAAVQLTQSQVQCVLSALELSEDSIRVVLTLWENAMSDALVIGPGNSPGVIPAFCVDKCAEECGRNIELSRLVFQTGIPWLRSIG